MKMTTDLFEQLDEAGRTHVLRTPDVKPRGAPEVPARAFQHPNKDHSELKKRHAGHYGAIEFSDEGDYVMVLVMSGGDHPAEYYGVNVLFYPNGKITASTSDKLAASQWKNDKDEIIKIAKASLKDEKLPGIYHGLGGHENLRGKGKLSVDVKEGKLSFKEFLLTEAKALTIQSMDKPPAITLLNTKTREKTKGHVLGQDDKFIYVRHLDDHLPHNVRVEPGVVTVNAVGGPKGYVDRAYRVHKSEQ
jgi:hypothetical protein